MPPIESQLRFFGIPVGPRDTLPTDILTSYAAKRAVPSPEGTRQRKEQIVVYVKIVTDSLVLRETHAIEDPDHLPEADYSHNEQINFDIPHRLPGFKTHIEWVNPNRPQK